VFLIENVAVILRALLAGILAISIFFLFCVFYRRFARKRYEQAREAAGRRYAQAVEDCLNGTSQLAPLVHLLKAADSAAERDGIRDLLLSRSNPATVQRITTIFYEIGEARRWARAAFGKRGDALVEAAFHKQLFLEHKETWRPLDWIRSMQLFALPRAIAVRYLGELAPEFAHPLLVEAMRDPSARVRQTAVAAMGRAQFPAAIPIILAELAKAVQEGNDLSVRDVKNALVRYGLEQLDAFLPALTHGDARVRFLVTDAVREIAAKAARRSRLRKNDFSPQLYYAFLDTLSADPDPDVRARCAEVVCHFHDQRSEQTLARLIGDDNEFVRLHAIRAARDYRDLAPALMPRITDSSWRVREAAVNVLAGLGARGATEIYSFFVSCTDRYASEQIADELQRGGLVPRLLAIAADDGPDRDTALKACRKLAVMGKSSLLVSALPYLDSVQTQIEIMRALSERPTPRFLQVLSDLAGSAVKPVAQAAAALLQLHEQRQWRTAAGLD
jgi:HEAT repeat protein